MSLDDALALAGQVMGDYEVAGLDGASGGERIWAGRLAQALRDLIAAASPDAGGAGDLSAAELLAAGRVLQDGLARAARQAARLEVASSTLATRAARNGGGRAGLRRRATAWARRAIGGRARRPVLAAGSVLLSAAEAATAGQALADAAAWQAQYGDYTGGGACPGSARHEVIIAAYAALQARLEAARR